MRAASPIALLLASACVRTVGTGPDLGDCADYPDGTYTWGQIGIGRCLAGPTDLEFLVEGDRTWLMVSNADPFRNFTSGSLLMLDATSFALGDDRLDVDDLADAVLPLDRFLGHIAVDRGAPGGAGAVIPSRLSPDSYTVGGLDRAWLVDLSEPSAPRLRSDRPYVSVRQDPFGAAIYDDKAWVLNPTDASFSIIDLRASPPGLIDPAPVTVLSAATLDDADGSGSLAEATVSPLLGDNVSTTDTWTAEWVDATRRAWLPTSVGLERFTSGGAAWVPSGLGVELSPEDYPTFAGAIDPWLTWSSSSLGLHLSIEGTIRRAFSDTSSGAWSPDSFVALSPQGWFEAAAGPAAVALDGTVLLYFDGLAANGRTAIGIAGTADGITYTPAEAPLLELADASLAQPSLILDPFTDSVRMWMSRQDADGRWSVALSESPDGFDAWTPPVPVLTVAGGDAGAPVVTWVGGRYEMHLSVRGAADSPWQHAIATSIDGVTWTTPIAWRTSDLTTDRPPRAAIQTVATTAWRVSGLQTGPLEGTIEEGLERQDATHNLRMRFASGHDVRVGLRVTGAENGIEPSQIADVQVPTLYATTADASGVEHLAALRQVAGEWGFARFDLIPAGGGGNVGGASAPVVYELDGTWRMLYAARDGAGSTALRVATSEDGLDWTPLPAPILTERATWDRSGQLPHAIERDADGWVLWMSGFDGSRWSIGRAVSPDGLTWTRDGEPTFEAGPPGTFDDAGVRDPAPDPCGGGLWYSAFDGGVWTIGYATFDGADWVRRTSPFTGDPSPALTPLPSTFAALGARSPIVQAADDTCTVYFAGSDGDAWRVGRAQARGGDLFPALRYPTTGDTLTFSTVRGETGTSELELAGVVDGAAVFSSAGGEGPSAVRVDAERGWMFVTSPGYPGVVVVDVRDDSTDTFVDRNYLGVETVLRLSSRFGLLGIRDLLLLPDGRLYLAAREPDSVYVIDTTGLVDDDVAEITDFDAIGALPLHDLTDDAGQPTEAPVGAAALAWVPGQELLLVAHFRDNSVSVFDLRRGAWGEEIRYLPDVGENPSTLAVSPDGSYAVVGCYLGEVTDEATNSSLALIDLRPDSPTWLEVTSRIVNR